MQANWPVETSKLALYFRLVLSSGCLILIRRNKCLFYYHHIIILCIFNINFLYFKPVFCSNEFAMDGTGKPCLDFLAVPHVVCGTSGSS